MANDHAVPLPALERLSTYIRCLMQLEHEGVDSVSSLDMERHTGVSAAQFRKDLSYFGEFGKRGIGYNVRELRARIAALLNVDREQNVLLVGAGNLGAALIGYAGWRSYRFRIAAVFDREPTKVGGSIRRLTVRHIDTVVEANREFGARIGILAVPAWEAQDVADRLIAAGVTGLINFAPIKLRVPPHVIVREVCFICELAVLSHLIHHAENSGDGTPPPPQQAREGESMEHGAHPGECPGDGTERSSPVRAQ